MAAWHVSVRRFFFGGGSFQFKHQGTVTRDSKYIIEVLPVLRYINEVLPVLRSRCVVILVSCVLSLKSYRQKNTLTTSDQIVTNALKTN